MKLPLPLLVLSVAWPISAPGGVVGVGTVVRAVLLGLLVFTTPGWVWKPALVLYLLYPWFAATVRVMRNVRERAEPQLEPLEADGAEAFGEDAAGVARQVEKLRSLLSGNACQRLLAYSGRWRQRRDADHDTTRGADHCSVDQMFYQETCVQESLRAMLRGDAVAGPCPRRGSGR